ncbi:hypothetical protein [Calothrix sp. UHCC 0171]|uniref:hypothetical protein n=1 Tax=Calothrix sp. UHCC 0171 TaxID=3110245 RepID=UPI002B1F2301|nr:hypothetical protein [Calothrix sp. UHCC 0171]MEA5572631.1 hypothetical protein [Calothrix sp. UHCC 0171]
MKKKVSLLAVSLAVFCFSPVMAQQNPELTRAEVYKLANLVDLLLSNQAPRKAKVKDALRPLDALQTKQNSLAELLFNEGSFLRVGSKAIFRFKPGLRRIQLKNGQVVAETIFELQSGTVVAITPPGSGGTTVEVPGKTRVEANMSELPSQTEALYSKNDGSAFSMTAYESQDMVVVSNLGVPIKVFSGDGQQFKILQPGQTIDVKNGVLGEVRTFDLSRFYATTKLAAGLGPGQEGLLVNESPQVQETFRLVRKDTIAAWKAQQDWIEGLCSINGRGVSSTLSTNCINTNSDEPLRGFEDRRDVTVPERRREVPQPQPEPEPQPQPELQPQPQPQPEPQPQLEPQQVPPQQNNFNQ